VCGYSPHGLLTDAQCFGRHCSCHLQSYCALAVTSSQAWITVDIRCGQNSKCEVSHRHVHDFSQSLQLNSVTCHAIASVNRDVRRCSPRNRRTDALGFNFVSMDTFHFCARWAWTTPVVSRMLVEQNPLHHNYPSQQLSQGFTTCTSSFNEKESNPLHAGLFP
jgi:hypothetical protein